MTKPDVYIYLDEFERDDVFVLSAAFVPADRASQLLADWDALRLEVKKVLLRDYPRTAQHPKLQGNQLPEIHAVDLFQSKGYYRKYRHGTKNDDVYWLQHYKWLEEALKIIQKHDIQFLRYSSSGPRHPWATEMLLEFFDGLDELITPIEEARILPRVKLKALATNPYPVALLTLLFGIEGQLKMLNLQGEVICDDHEMSKGFSIIESVDWLRERGSYTHLTPPRFASGLDEFLLQVSDVLCYVEGRYAHANTRNISLKQPLDEWLERFINPALVDAPDYEETQIHNMMITIFELFFQLSIQNPEVREVMKRIARNSLKEY